MTEDYDPDSVDPWWATPEGIAFLDRWDQSRERAKAKSLQMMALEGAGSVFNPEPKSWGLRGDPLVWRSMKGVLRGTKLPETDEEANQLFHSTLETVARVDLSDPYQELKVEREEFAHEGMSSGMIDLEYWKAILLPMLVARVRAARGDESLDGANRS